MDIDLIRHGECFDSPAEYYDECLKTINPPLTEKGLAQAQSLAARLSGTAYDRIYASDLVRARQTAEILSQAVHCELIVTPWFREIDMGDILTKSWQAFQEIFQQWQKHEEDIPYPNGESGIEAWARYQVGLNAITAVDSRRVAIVCHGGTIRSIICGILAIPQQKRFAFGSPLANCSISTIRWENGVFSLHSFNDYATIDN
jgi:broad specificity phosphatase PhoE